MWSLPTINRSNGCLLPCLLGYSSKQFLTRVVVLLDAQEDNDLCLVPGDELWLRYPGDSTHSARQSVGHVIKLAAQEEARVQHSPRPAYRNEDRDNVRLRLWRCLVAFALAWQRNSF